MKTKEVKKKNVVQLVTKEQQVANDIKYVFREVSERMNSEEPDEEFGNYNKCVVVLLDDKHEYDYTIITANLKPSETLGLLEIVKADTIRQI